MNHAFPTRRNELDAVRDGIRALEDIAIILTVTRADKVCIVGRMDDNIENKDVRRAVCRHSSRLGLLLKDVEGIASASLSKQHGTSCHAFLQGNEQLPVDLHADLETVLVELRRKKEELEATEMDDSSSSYSDYSASDTETSDGESASSSG